MPRDIFISYRRDDDPGMALALYGHLEKAFSEQLIFMDIEDGIPPGHDFVQVLEERVAQCHVMLALIGEHWIEARDRDGRQRLDNPNDFVCIEIESAMRLGKLIIPVLINKTEMPRADELPDSMKAFVRRQAIHITAQRLRADALGVVQKIERGLAEIPRQDKARATPTAPAAERSGTSRTPLSALSPPTPSAFTT